LIYIYIYISSKRLRVLAFRSKDYRKWKQYQISLAEGHKTARGIVLPTEEGEEED
jgi:hypothetical protein